MLHIIPSETQMTQDLLAKLIEAHKGQLARYLELQKEYEARHVILDAPKKDGHKPDNRLVVNFAGYIVDTLNGFFAGIPVKVSHDDAKISDYLERVHAYNDQSDNNAELTRMAEIYGHAFELMYMDDTEIGITYVSPMEAFAVYDDSIVRRQLYGVRYYKDTDGVVRGSFSDAHTITYFHEEGGKCIFGEEILHPFGGVPLYELLLNEERRSVFEGVLTLMRAYDKAMSEKANDVDYYADAYLSVLGAELDDNSMKNLRDSRIINLTGRDADKIVVQFLQKPDADATQENLINRIEKLIFHISMVANISDEEFGNASGISLRYKLQAMDNLAQTLERKFSSLLNRRYKLLCACPLSPMGAEEWMRMRYTYSRKIPANLLEESQIAGNLAGVTSAETQLSVLSCVDSVQAELDRKEAESLRTADTMGGGGDAWTRTGINEASN